MNRQHYLLINQNNEVLNQTNTLKDMYNYINKTKLNSVFVEIYKIDFFYENIQLIERIDM